MSKCTSRRGAALIVALVTLLVVMLVAAALIRSMLVAHRQAELRQNELQAAWLAEAAVARAAAQLALQPDYKGETWTVAVGKGSSAIGVAEIRLEQSDAKTKVIVLARYPDHPIKRVTARREYVLSRPTAAGGPRPTPAENAP